MNLNKHVKNYIQSVSM